MSKTSWQVKQRYNSKAYGRINVLIDKDLVERFKQKCADYEISQASVIKGAVEQFLKDTEEEQS